VTENNTLYSDTYTEVCFSATYYCISRKKSINVVGHKYDRPTIRYDTIEEFNVDSKAEYTA